MVRFIALVVLLAAVPQERQQGQKPAPDVAAASYGPHERNVLDLWIW